MTKRLAINDNILLENREISLSELTPCKTIFTNSNNGFNITVEETALDKIPILVIGIGNNGGIEVIIIQMRNGVNNGTYKVLSGDRVVTNDGFKYHINAVIYSSYMVLFPPSTKIKLTQGSL